MDYNVKKIEHEALIRCLRLATGAVVLEELQAALSLITDWGYLRQIAVDQGVFPSLYRRVADTFPQAVPREVLADWQKFYKTHARRNLKITAELIRILDLLRSQGITAVPYKGPVLASVAYGDIALRQFVDLDLLVSPAEVGKLKEALFAAGYRLPHALTPRQERDHLRNDCQFTFVNPQCTALDVHWRFMGAFMGAGLDTDEVLSRKVPVVLEGKTVLTLAPEDLLLMLCLDGTLYFWSTLVAVNDVARLVQAYPSWDWPGLLDRAQRLGLQRMLLLGLYLAHNLMGAPVPREVIAQSQASPAVLELSREVTRQMFEKHGQAPGFAWATWFHARSFDRLKDKIHYYQLRSTGPTLQDWRWVPLPDSCYGLYYLIRPLRLGLQGVASPLMRQLTGWMVRLWTTWNGRIPH